MRSLLSAILATGLVLAIGANGHADELVLQLKPIVGDEKTVTVKAVDAGDSLQGRIVSMQGRYFPTRLLANDKKYLALSSPSSSQYNPHMFIALPWQNIKEIAIGNTTSTVTCTDGKFTGTILTEITNTDDVRYPLAQCTKVTVKKVAPSERKNDAGPPAKCTVQYDKLAQSFTAKRLGFATSPGLSDEFKMKVDGKELDLHLSNFEKIIVKGKSNEPTRITVRTPGGEETEGELLGVRSLVFHTPNDCFILVELGSANITAAFEATRRGEKLPKELNNPLRKGN